MKFKVGDRVLLSKESRFYGQPHQLPIGVIGTVSVIRKEQLLPVIVTWAAGHNCYLHNDLRPAKDHYIKKFKELYEQL